MPTLRRIGVAARCLTLGAFVTLASCGVTPARRDVAPTPDRPLSGEFTAVAHSAFVGPVAFRLHVEPTPDGFKANTPPGRAWTFIGGVERVLAPFLTPFLFPQGMILTWQSSLPVGDQPGTGTLGVGSLDSLRVKTCLHDLHAPAEITFRDGRVMALLSLTPARDAATTDYPALARELARVVPAAVYDPEIARSAQLRAYLADVERGGTRATDDLEFLLAAGAAGRKHTRWAIPLPYPRPATDRAPLPGLTSPARVSRDPETADATIRFDAFLDPALVDAAFAQALSPPPPALTLDLRTCPGFDLASLHALAWLITEPADAGIYFDRAWRARLLQGSPNVIDDVPTLDVSSDTTIAQVHAALREHGALQVRVRPRPDAYRGPVTILTASRTTSTAEALVAALRGRPGVTTRGKPTGGRPFLAREEDLGQGWAVRVAAYDYLAPGGQRIGPAGIAPDVATSDAPSAAVRLITPN